MLFSQSSSNEKFLNIWFLYHTSFIIQNNCKKEYPDRKGYLVAYSNLSWFVIIKLIMNIEQKMRHDVLISFSPRSLLFQESKSSHAPIDTWKMRLNTVGDMDNVLPWHKILSILQHGIRAKEEKKHGKEWCIYSLWFLKTFNNISTII